MNSPHSGDGLPGRLTRFGSAPSSFLAALAAPAAVDSAAPAEAHFSNFFPDVLTCHSTESTSGNNKRKADGLDLIRHRSSPPGFLSHLLLDTGFGGDTLSFSSRQGSFSQLSELGVGEANSSDVSSGGLAWDEGSSGDIIANQLFRLHEDSVPCKVRAKRGCATHPRSIAERERRTRISEKLKKLEDLVPDVDKQTSTADMLDLAVQYIKTLQEQLEKLRNENENCTCTAKLATL